jgi:HEPN domain-containing protein
MSRIEEVSEDNLEYAQRWLTRATKDFNAFKKLAIFDKKTHKIIQCSDPALAVYLLQQSVEKAVKAVAIASGQYTVEDLKGKYGHNSLALILNLYRKIITQIKFLGLGPIVDLMGVDLENGLLKLTDLENKAFGSKPVSVVEEDRTESIRSESIRISPEVMDQILDMLIRLRSLFLGGVRSAFRHLPELGIRNGRGTVEDTEAFIELLSLKMAADLKTSSLSEAQLKAILDLNKATSFSVIQSSGGIKRSNMINVQLGIWGLSIALVFLTYFTFAHEHTSRYPRELESKDKGGKVKLGCEDYDNSLGIVNRLGRIAYVTSLTLNDIKKEPESIALFFTKKSVP